MAVEVDFLVVKHFQFLGVHSCAHHFFWSAKNIHSKKQNDNELLFVNCTSNVDTPKFMESTPKLIVMYNQILLKNVEDSPQTKWVLWVSFIKNWIASIEYTNFSVTSGTRKNQFSLDFRWHQANSSQLSTIYPELVFTYHKRIYIFYSLNEK